MIAAVYKAPVDVRDAAILCAVWRQWALSNKPSTYRDVVRETGIPGPGSVLRNRVRRLVQARLMRLTCGEDGRGSRTLLPGERLAGIWRRRSTGEEWPVVLR